jgi:hypothetical protein
MVPLSEEEQRLLEQMEEALAAEDPKFVSALRGSSTRSRHKRLTILGCLGFLIGLATLMTGAVVAKTPVAVLGFVLMLGGAYLALTHFRQIGEADPDDNVQTVRFHEPDGRPLAPPPRRLLIPSLDRAHMAPRPGAYGPSTGRIWPLDRAHMAPDRASMAPRPGDNGPRFARNLCPGVK